MALLLVAVPATSALAAAAVEMDPVQGKPGDVFEISGQGFGIDEKVQLDWDSIRLGNTRTDELGRFSASFAVPAEASPGTHTVKATGRPSTLSATATFTVLAPPTTTTTLAPTTTVATTTTVAANGKSNTPSGLSPLSAPNRANNPPRLAVAIKKTQAPRVVEIPRDQLAHLEKDRCPNRVS